MTRTPVSEFGARDEFSRSRRSLRILVADDDRDTVMSLMALLREEGYETRAVYRGDDVVPVAEEFNPDALLLDIGMPGQTGYDIARELRERDGPNCPMLIAVTGWNKGSDKILAELAGFDHHLGKPYDPNHLLKLLTLLRISKLGSAK